MSPIQEELGADRQGAGSEWSCILLVPANCIILSFLLLDIFVNIFINYKYNTYLMIQKIFLVDCFIHKKLSYISSYLHKVKQKLSLVFSLNKHK